MKIQKNYKITIYACYLAYTVQGIINNISPILFAIYQTQLHITLDKISLLIAINFGVQILVDFLAAQYADRMGYRRAVLLAHGLSAAGLISLCVLPRLLPEPITGLVIATCLNGVGSGLIEVLVSPIVEAAPGEEKEKAMSLLHSFYCWGCVGFILISTLLLRLIGTERWFFLPLIWAVIPFFNFFLFIGAPIRQLTEQGSALSRRKLFTMKGFWPLVLLMLCSGATEMGMSQWASYFAEMGLHVNKTVGDILGPCSFCFLMGLSRLFFGKSQRNLPLAAFMRGSCLLSVASYLLAVFAPHPLLGLLGCSLCGLSVGILWPGTFSLAAKTCRAGGTAMFAFLALAGDLGCISGPQAVSIVSQLFPGYGLRAGLLAAVFFPALMLILLCRIRPSTDDVSVNK